jgi:hypothetical protein
MRAVSNGSADARGSTRCAAGGSPICCAPEFETTAWLRMQSEAKRSRGRIFPAICDLQGDFRKMQGEPILTPVDLLMVSITWKKFSRPQGAGRDCGCCREDFGKLQGGAAWNCEWWQGWRRFHFALAGLTMASVRKRTWKIANRRGESGWVVDYTDDRGCRQRKHFQTKKAADSLRIKTEGAPTGGGAIVQTMWGTAADRSRCNRVCQCGEDFEDTSDTRTIRRDAPGGHPCRRLP